MGWYNTSWKYRIKITVDYTKVDATLTDFSVYVDLSDLPADFFSNVKSDGGDIRITQANGTTEQAREIVFINTGSSIGELHFKASSISSSTDTDFYIYYGNPAASEPAPDSTYGSESVWDANYKLVAHNHEDPSSSNIFDSTSNDNDGTPGAGMTSGDSVTGILAGNMLDFDDTSTDYVDHGVASSLRITGDITMSCWVNIDSVANTPWLVTKWEGAADRSYGIGIDGAAPQNIKFSISSTGTNEFNAKDVSSPPTSTDCYIVGTYDGSTIRLYIDGSEVDTTSVTTTIKDSTVSDVVQGQRSDKSGSFALDGRIDEVRISNSTRSANWISTEYNNQNSPGTFYSVGAQEVSFIPKIIII